MKHGLTVLILMSVMAWLVVPAAADDVWPPSWRGEWSTTFQYWEFEADDTGQTPGGMPPDGPGTLVEGMPGEPYLQPGYLGGTHLKVYPNPDQWISSHYTGRTGIWELSGNIDVTVKNHLTENPYKWVYVQITWRPEDDFPTATPYINNMNPVPVNAADMPKVTNEKDWGDGWKTTLFEWYLRPNPDLEEFTINGSILVDQLVVDTWCVPEPSTLAMLLSVSLVALGWRRRR